jgi:hypothetical protein
MRKSIPLALALAVSACAPQFGYPGISIGLHRSLGVNYSQLQLQGSPYTINQDHPPSLPQVKAIAMSSDQESCPWGYDEQAACQEWMDGKFEQHKLQRKAEIAAQPPGICNSITCPGARAMSEEYVTQHLQELVNDSCVREFQQPFGRNPMAASACTFAR